MSSKLQRQEYLTKENFNLLIQYFKKNRPIIYKSILNYCNLTEEVDSLYPLFMQRVKDEINDIGVIDLRKQRNKYPGALEVIENVLYENPAGLSYGEVLKRTADIYKGSASRLYQMFRKIVSKKELYPQFEVTDNHIKIKEIRDATDHNNTR